MASRWLLGGLLWAPFVALADEQLPVMDCLLTPYVVVDLGSPTAGVLEHIGVKRGDPVRKGAFIANLESGEEQASVALAEARADFRARKMARNEQLYADDLISIHDKDEMATESALSALELRVVQERLARRTITSPIDGVVVEVLTAPGEYVQEEPVMRLAQIDPINVEVVVPARFFGLITRGMQGTVRPELGSEATAVVDVVDAVIDAASGTFGVRLALRNPGNRIPAGQKCSVEFAASN